MTGNLNYLSLVFDQPLWSEKCYSLIRSLGQAIVKNPASFGVWAMVVQQLTKGTLEIAITGQQANTFLSPVLERYIPNKILQVEETNSSLFPLLAGKTGINEGKNAFYICENYACMEPFLTIEDFLAIM